MDTSETYIKMCDCPEIQSWKLWKHNSIHRAGTDFFHYHYVGARKLENSVWLPRQDQIQEMMWNKEGPVHPFRLFPRLVLWFDESWNNMPELSGLNTPEQLWLAFYMHEKHGKIWNGEKWINAVA